MFLQPIFFISKSQSDSWVCFHSEMNPHSWGSSCSHISGSLSCTPFSFADWKGGRNALPCLKTGHWLTWRHIQNKVKQSKLQEKDPKGLVLLSKTQPASAQQLDALQPSAVNSFLKDDKLKTFPPNYLLVCVQIHTDGTFWPYSFLVVWILSKQILLLFIIIVIPSSGCFLDCKISSSKLSNLCIKTVWRRVLVHLAFGHFTLFKIIRHWC